MSQWVNEYEIKKNKKVEDLLMLTLFEVGGGRSTPPVPKIISETLKMASKYPQISWLFLFLCDLSDKQNFFCFFHSDFGSLEGGGGEHPHQ